MKIVFFGTSKYCLPVLDALKPQLELVVARPDKPVGRKQILTPCATKIWAIKNNIHLQETTSLEGKFDLGIVADYGRIIPEEEFNIPKLGTFNIHFSKLPDLRGASPVQQTLLRGNKTAWVTIFKIEKTLDTGPVLDQREFPIFPDDTAETLYTRLFEEVAKYLPERIMNYELRIMQGEKNILIPQDHAKATYCQRLTKQDGFVKWSDIENCELRIENYNHFRAMTPWPGLWTLRPAQGKLQRMKILKCHLDQSSVTGHSSLVLDEIQFEGKKPEKTH
jgi:methionyl-tRNA formyltransferase